VRAPGEGDLSKPHTVTSHAESSSESTDAAAATIEDAKPAESEPGAAPAPEPGGPRLQTDDAVISDARAASAKFAATLPNYLVQQLTVRYFSPSSPPRWQEIDQVTADLAYVEGKEDYRNFRIRGEPIDRPEQSGSWSTGEFSTTLDDVLSPVTNAAFHRRGEEKLNGRTTIVFNYTVAQSNSHWTMVSPDQRRYNPPYEGAIWVDKDTRRVLKIEQRTSFMPADWPFRGAETSLEYGFIKIEQKTYLLPARAENVACMSGSGACTRNLIEFRNYRKFTTESNVRFGQ
jgi:hypothetical protein